MWLTNRGTIVGPPADMTWLRIYHRLDPRNGEHELRAASSRDGRHWGAGRCLDPLRGRMTTRVERSAHAYHDGLRVRVNVNRH